MVLLILIGPQSVIVKFQGEVSGTLDIGAGVPQGSVLGPLLFLLYVNDLPGVIKYGHCTSFADDTTLLWHHTDTTVLSTMINEDLGHIEEWCDSNKLAFNISKTNILNFKCNLSNISFENGEVSNLRENKFLGILIDNRLKFERHIDVLASKISSSCYAIRIIKSNVSFTVAKQAYFSLVESHLRYGVSFWGSCSATLFQTVFILQKRAIRYLCTTGSRESCKPYFLEHKILTLPCLFRVGVSNAQKVFIHDSPEHWNYKSSIYY